MKSMLLGLSLIAFAAQAQCPINECNYLDAQYTTAYSSWSTCLNTVAAQWTRGMDVLAISYPRFGIAWSSQKTEIETAFGANTTNHDEAVAEAHRRFEDRILQAAEPEALQYYNIFRIKFERQIKQCGSMPEPPKGQPQ